MILVTGAAGKTGQAVTRALARRGTSVRALVRRPEQATTLHEIGATDVVSGDLANVADLVRACDGVAAVYLICPNMHPDEVDVARQVMAAAHVAGVGRFVYHSVLHPQIQAMAHHWRKLQVEELLFETDFDWTILQPAAYMQNVLAYWPAIVDEGVYRAPYALSTRLGMVDLGEVAEVAARVLMEEGHHTAIYELAGGEVLTQNEVARTLAEHLGRPVRAEAIDRGKWEREARRTGLSGYAVSTLLRMFEYYERYGFWGNSFVLTQLLGRPPKTFTEFLQRLP